MTCKYCQHCNQIKKNNLKKDAKNCIDCKELKSLSEYNIRQTCKDGIIKLRADCKACQVHRNKAAYARRKAKMKMKV